MKILQPEFKIEYHKKPKKMLKFIEKIGRTCYKSEGNISEDGSSASAFIRRLIDNEHEAMIEHMSISVCFTVDRGITHELVRHRMASFAQESTRYCNYANEKFGQEISYIDIEGQIKNDYAMQQGLKNGKIKEKDILNVIEEWYDACRDAERHYFRMLEFGATPQIARSVLNNSTKADIWITANLREWRAILSLRAEEPAHPGMRQVMCRLLKQFKEDLPEVFEDIYCADIENDSKKSTIERITIDGFSYPIDQLNLDSFFQPVTRRYFKKFLKMMRKGV